MGLVWSSPAPCAMGPPMLGPQHGTGSVHGPVGVSIGVAGVSTALVGGSSAGSCTEDYFYHTRTFPQLPSVHALIPANLPGMPCSGGSREFRCFPWWSQDAAEPSVVFWEREFFGWIAWSSKCGFGVIEPLWKFKLSLDSAFRQKMNEKYEKSCWLKP